MSLVGFAIASRMAASSFASGKVTTGSSARTGLNGVARPTSATTITNASAIPEILPIDLPFLIAVPPFCSVSLLIHGLDNHLILPERRQAVSAFSTSYMGYVFTKKPTENTGASL